MSPRAVAGRRPTGRRRRFRVAFTLLATLLFATPILATADSAAARASTAPVRVSVVSVTPSSPRLSQTPQPLTVVLRVTNATSAALTGLRIRGYRGEPLESQAALDDSRGDASWPDDGLEIQPRAPVRVSVAARSSAAVSFRTDTDIPQDAGICLCHQAVYPLYFGVFRGSGTRLAAARTYLPVFSSAPVASHVAWVWPLIDRPHRTTSDTVFTDDDLTALVAVNGRLDRALEVLERVGRARVPVTAVVDPELLDELSVMSTGNYQIRTSASATATQGIGSSAASAWLGRLRAVLTNDPSVSIVLTPYADPDVQTLTAQGLAWAPRLASTRTVTTMNATMTQRVTQALAGRALRFDTAWPAAGAISRDTLSRLRGAGVRTLILNAGAVRQEQVSSLPAATARLRAGGTTIATALLSSTMQADAATVIANPNGTGLAQLPYLLAEIAIAPAQEPDARHDVVLAAPRYVDPDPDTAYRAVVDTTHAPYASGSTLSAVTAALPSATSQLAAVPTSTARLPGAILDEVRSSAEILPKLDSMLGASATATSEVLTVLPAAVQRSASSAWRTPERLRAVGTARANTLNTTLTTLITGVHIVFPSGSRSYTLGSSTSTLPLTVQNDLDDPVRIRIDIRTAKDVPGFRLTRDIGVQTIAPGAKRTLKLPSDVTRPGRISIVAKLLTPGGDELGNKVTLTVRSTALGAVGVIITAVAGAVLVLALLRRFVRRFRGGGNRDTPVGAKPADADPVGSSR